MRRSSSAELQLAVVSRVFLVELRRRALRLAVGEFLAVSRVEDDDPRTASFLFFSARTEPSWAGPVPTMHAARFQSIRKKYRVGIRKSRSDLVLEFKFLEI
jgi:hypothetical protein